MAERELFRYIVLLLWCIFISKEDIKTKSIKNKHLLYMAGIGAVLILASLNRDIYFSALLGMLLGFLISFLVSWFSKEGIGMGDVKLIAVVGLYLGAERLGIAVFWGLVLVLLFGIFRLVTKKADRKTEYPFAPFFTGGIFIAFCMQMAA